MRDGPAEDLLSDPMKGFLTKRLICDRGTMASPSLPE